MDIDRAESDGVVLGLRLNPVPSWIFGVNYTYTNSRKYSAASSAWSRNVQLPYNKLNLNATWLIREASLSADGYWVDGTRLRWNGLDKMDSYFKLDLACRIPQNNNFTWTLRITNLLDEDYYEAMGYREAGFGAFRCGGDTDSQQGDRLCFPVPPPPAGILGIGECDAAGLDRRNTGARSERAGRTDTRHLGAD